MNIHKRTLRSQSEKACSLVCGNVPCRLQTGRTDRWSPFSEHSILDESPYARRLSLSVPAILGLIGTDHHLQESPETRDKPSYELRLQPGTTLYADADDHDYVFLILSGIVEQRRVVHRSRRHGGIRYSGCGDIIAPGGLRPGETETAVTTTWSDFLAIPCRIVDAGPTDDGWAPDQTPAILGRSQAGRSAYEPFNHPESRRLAEALSYLLSISGKRSMEGFLESMLPMNLSYDSLAEWTGLDLAAVRGQASKLCRVGAVCPADNRLISVCPQALSLALDPSL